ncbi:MAG: DNA polymerase I [Phycisphaerae bacterium]|nr:MAG: DNA polymerase I [Phycisphaerae bacterium]
MPKSLFVIDGHAQIYRSYYAPFRPLTSPTGEPTKAVYVFCSTLFTLLRDKKPDYLVMTLDVSDRTVFRCDIYPEYKAQRDPAPDDLHPQADRIVEIVQAMGIPVLRQEGYEADDLMATLAKRLAGDDLDVYLVSKDKDLEQVISDHVFLYDPGKNVVLDRKALLENKGYAPEQVIDIQTLSGDSVDNIPGVAGVGPKTAVKLINKYGTAQAVVEHADELTPKQSQNVKAFAEHLPITRQLVTLLDDVDFEFDLESARTASLTFGNARPTFESLGFNRLTDQLDELAGEDDVQGELPLASSEDLGEYVCVDTDKALDELAAELEKQSIFAIDTETTNINPVVAELAGISVSWEAGKAYYIPIRAAMGKCLALESVREKLAGVLGDVSIGKVGQNIKYDAIVLEQAGMPLGGIAFDTMIASFVLEPLRRSHGMNALVLELCGHRMIPISDLIGKGKDQLTIDQVDAAHVTEYAGEDADFTWRLYEILSKQLEESSFKSLFEDVEMPLVSVLARMESNGVSLDESLLAKMSDDLGDRLLELTAEIHEAAGYAFNIASTKQLAVVLFDEQKLPVIKKTKTGRSTDAATLEALVQQTDNPIPRLMLEYRELTKLKGTYLDTLPQMVCRKTDRIHAGFHQTGAVTGRLSSSDPNLQNIPIRTELGRRIRGAFVASGSDRTLVVADYSQIELRVLAHFSKDEALLAAFENGLDIHAAVAAQVNDVSIEEVTSEQRSAAKAVNFGIVYGQTAFGLARSLGISQGAAREFIDRYNDQYLGIKGFVDQCIAEAKEKGYAETILGRRRPIDELHSRNKQQQALGARLAVNTVIQGTAADMIKRAMIDIHREIASNELDVQMLIQVHDELVFEVAKVEVDAHVAMIRDKMVNAISFDVPIVVDIGKGATWLDAK